MKKIFILIVLFSGIAASSFAQVTANALASAIIITPINIAKSVDLAFGNVAVLTATGGTVVLPPSASPTRIPTGGVTLPGVTGTVAAAKFDVTGAASTTFSISLPSVIVPLTKGTDHMDVDAFLSSIGLVGTLTSGGIQSFYVGSTLHVTAAQPAGNYAGNFDVTVNYN